MLMKGKVVKVVAYMAGHPTCSGFADGDYPCLDISLPALADLPVLSSDVHHVPLPSELIEEFQSILTNKYCTSFTTVQ